ncbi:MAG: Card1-like endonuclease domain-containing protein, partial [Sarcina sp.]
GSIIIDSTEVCNLNIIEELTLAIANNLELWQKYKIRLSDNSIFIHDDSNPNFMKIDFQILDKEEKSLLHKCLEFLNDKKQIKYKEENGYIKIYFLSNFIKGFIFKSGTWLEVLTKYIVEKIDVIDDVKSGVLFLWNDEQTRVKNELDVVAIKDSVLICISCKDSKKYDEVALNELDVYGEQLGGDNVIKILVATKKPLKSSVIHRAKEMDINLVIFDGNISRFKENLKNIIKNN